MKTQKLVALGIFVLVAAWLFYPRSATRVDAENEGESRPAITVLPENSDLPAESTDFTVRATRLTAQRFVENVRVRGRTKAYRIVEVRAELTGRVIDTPAVRGSRVEPGDILCEIAVDARDADLQEAESRQQQTRFEYDAALDLRQQGLQSAVAVAQAKAAFDSATAAVARAELALNNTKITAPFAGIVESRTVEIGDLLDRGNVCATILDDSPMLLAGLVPEQQIGKIKLEAPVKAELLTGEQVTGTVNYLSRSAEAQSRSYQIEVEIDDRFSDIRDGITSEILIEAAEIQAHLIPASALTLNDEGEIGVKTLGSNNVVAFNAIEIVGDETSTMNGGIWVTGLPREVSLITHGQEIVFPGQQVESEFNWSTGTR